MRAYQHAASTAGLSRGCGGGCQSRRDGCVHRQTYAWAFPATNRAGARHASTVAHCGRACYMQEHWCACRRVRCACVCRPEGCAQHFATRSKTKPKHTRAHTTSTTRYRTPGRHRVTQQAIGGRSSIARHSACDTTASRAHKVGARTCSLTMRTSAVIFEACTKQLVSACTANSAQDVNQCNKKNRRLLGDVSTNIIQANATHSAPGLHAEVPW